LLQRFDDSALVRCVQLRKNDILQRCKDQSEVGAAHSIEIRTGDDLDVRRIDQPNPPRNRFGGQSICAGYDDDANASLAASFDQLHHFWLRRLLERGKSEKGEITFDIACAPHHPFERLFDGACGKRDDPLTLAGILIDGVLDLLPHRCRPGRWTTP
jgi:hypothetical protein